MSEYLTSIISSINGQSDASASSDAKPNLKPRLGDATKDVGASTGRPISPLKRKPEDDQKGPQKRAARDDEKKSLASAGNRPTSSSGLAPRLAATTLNKGSTTANSKSEPSASANPLVSKLATQNTTTTSSVPPKKGSYRDMMQRARAAQASQPPGPPAGQIKHSTAVSKKKLERREAREQARQASKDGKGTKTAPGQLSNVSGVSSQSKKTEKVGLGNPAEKKKKARPPLEYRGTMRTSAARTSDKTGPSKTTPTPAKRPAQGYSSESGSDLDAPGMAKRYTYADCTDEEEDEGYDSERSSDMEGVGFDALEAEEETSLRAARKEDAEALREEEAHRREKLERKKKLQQLAAKTSKQKYK